MALTQTGQPAANGVGARRTSRAAGPSLFLARSHWEPDELKVVCSGCRAAFNLFTRRHHCRICGLLFCARCCAQEVMNQRACTKCFAMVSACLASRMSQEMCVKTITEKIARRRDGQSPWNQYLSALSPLRAADTPADRPREPAPFTSPLPAFVSLLAQTSFASSLGSALTPAPAPPERRYQSPASYQKRRHEGVAPANRESSSRDSSQAPAPAPSQPLYSFPGAQPHPPARPPTGAHKPGGMYKSASTPSLAAIRAGNVIANRPPPAPSGDPLLDLLRSMPAQKQPAGLGARPGFAQRLMQLRSAHRKAVMIIPPRRRKFKLILPIIFEVGESRTPQDEGEDSASVGSVTAREEPRGTTGGEEGDWNEGDAAESAEESADEDQQSLLERKAREVMRGSRGEEEKELRERVPNNNGVCEGGDPKEGCDSDSLSATDPPLASASTVKCPPKVHMPAHPLSLPPAMSRPKRRASQ